MEKIHLGGLNAAKEERIYMHDAHFQLNADTDVWVTRSYIHNVHMPSLFARHEARYDLVRFFCRPDMQVLDFPCGTGYAADLLASRNVRYTGLDIDHLALAYAREVYCREDASVTFDTGDLCNPQLPLQHFHVAACIEGLEHIGMDDQDTLIAALRASLKPGGVLIVSSPENPTGASGQSPNNTYHKGDLTQHDFLALLHRHFEADKVEVITTCEVLSTGIRSRCFFGICHA